MIFILCLIFFVGRGPYRAIRFSTTGDFSTIYAASRNWVHGENPYNRESLKNTLRAIGAPRDLERDQDINLSVYLPSALAWSAPLALLPWAFANTVWCLLSLLLFALSIYALVKAAAVRDNIGLLLASFSLLFSPTYVGVYVGNPSVLSISLTTLSLFWPFLRLRWAAGLCLGIACCYKPQIGSCALVVLALWRRWKTLGTGILIASNALVLGVAVAYRSGHADQWWADQSRNIAASLTPGGPSDPSPTSSIAWQMLNTQTLSSYAFDNQQAANWAVWIFVFALAALFFILRTRSSAKCFRCDVAFFATLSLTAVYHRYYDAQLLLIAIPCLFLLWKWQRRGLVILVAVCFIALTMPLESAFARLLGGGAYVASPEQFALLRFQPLAVLALAFALAFVYVDVRQSGEETKT